MMSRAYMGGTFNTYEQIPASISKRFPTEMALRSLIPPGLVCMAASEGDDPAIVETWF
jgi:hypothetical protein